MRSRLTLIVVCCSIVIGSLAFLNYKSTPQVAEGNAVANTQFSTANSLTPNQKQLEIDTAISNPNRENSQSTPVKKSPEKKPSISKLVVKTKKSPNKNRDCSAPNGKNSYMRLERTERKNKLGNPLYRLCLYARGQLLTSYYSVTGRAYTQYRNRHRSGTQARDSDHQVVQ